MVWIDDLVADLVDGRLSVELEVLDFELLLNNCVANGVPSYASRRLPGAVLLVRFADNGPRG
jgi:hypothetical protein